MYDWKYFSYTGTVYRFKARGGVQVWRDSDWQLSQQNPERLFTEPEFVEITPEKAEALTTLSPSEVLG